MTEFEEYMKTGILGSYHPERVTGFIESGEVMPVFRDAEFRNTESGCELKREMVVGERRFLIHSIFPSDNEAETPTEKILRIIQKDSEI